MFLAIADALEKTESMIMRLIRLENEADVADAGCWI